MEGPFINIFNPVINSFNKHTFSDLLSKTCTNLHFFNPDIYHENCKIIMKMYGTNMFLGSPPPAMCTHENN